MKVKYILEPINKQRVQQTTQNNTIIHNNNNVVAVQEEHYREVLNELWIKCVSVSNKQSAHSERLNWSLCGI